MRRLFLLSAMEFVPEPRRPVTQKGILSGESESVQVPRDKRVIRIAARFAWRLMLSRSTVSPGA